eukprot:623760-Rhodomonas_salina.1
MPQPPGGPRPPGLQPLHQLGLPRSVTGRQGSSRPHPAVTLGGRISKRLARLERRLRLGRAVSVSVRDDATAGARADSTAQHWLGCVEGQARKDAPGVVLEAAGEPRAAVLVSACLSSLCGPSLSLRASFPPRPP